MYAAYATAPSYTTYLIILLVVGYVSQVPKATP